jgi:hypothetical protein
MKYSLKAEQPKMVHRIMPASGRAVWFWTSFAMPAGTSLENVMTHRANPKLKLARLKSEAPVDAPSIFFHITNPDVHP